MQADAQISLRKISGISFNKISLAMPPKQPVTVPRATQMPGENCIQSLFECL